MLACMHAFVYPTNHFIGAQLNWDPLSGIISLFNPSNSTYIFYP